MELLLGMESTAILESSTQKIFLICFMLISVKYSADFYSDIFDIKFVNEIVPFDTFQSINNSDLKLYVEKCRNETFFLRTTDPYIKDMKRKVKQVFNLTRCLKMIEEKICNVYSLRKLPNKSRESTQNENCKTGF